MADQVAAAGECSTTLRFAFGLNKAAAIAELRALADKLESREAILQKISTAQIATDDDFGMYEVAITFAERNPHFDAAKRAEQDDAREAQAA